MAHQTMEVLGVHVTESFRSASVVSCALRALPIASEDVLNAPIGIACLTHAQENNTFGREERFEADKVAGKIDL